MMERAVTNKVAAALASVILALALAGVLAAPQEAMAGELAATGLAVQSSDNTTQAKAVTVPLGDKGAGVCFDAADAIGSSGTVYYWFTYNIGSRYSEYTITVQSVEGVVCSARMYNENTKSMHDASLSASSPTKTFTESINNSDYFGKARYIRLGIGKKKASGGELFRVTVEERCSVDNVDNVQSFTYDGTAKAQNPVVKADGEVLSYGTDYEVTYQTSSGKAINASDVVDAGTYKLVVTGTGSYTGEIKKSFAINKATVAIPSGKMLVYNGESQTGVTATPDCTVSGNMQTDAGSYSATAKLLSTKNYQWEDGSTGYKYISWTIAPAAQTVTAKAKTVKVSAKKLKKQSGTIKASKVCKGVNAKTALTYEKVKASKKSSKFQVYSDGTILVKKGLKKGTYKVTVEAQAASSGNYKAASKNFVVTVKVK